MHLCTHIVFAEEERAEKRSRAALPLSLRRAQQTQGTAGAASTGELLCIATVCLCLALPAVAPPSRAVPCLACRLKSTAARPEHTRTGQRRKGQHASHDCMRYSVVCARPRHVCLLLAPPARALLSSCPPFRPSCQSPSSGRSPYVATEPSLLAVAETASRSISTMMNRLLPLQLHQHQKSNSVRSDANEKSRWR
jgi:hypothetical protein